VLFWGSTFLWVEIAIAQTSPLTIVATRLLAGAIVVVAVTRMLTPRIRDAHTAAKLRPWFAPGIVLALLAAVIPGALIAVAQQSIESGTASIVNATAPLWTALLTWIVIGASAGRLSGFQVSGLGFGILGVALLVGDAPSGGEVKGQLLVVFVALVYSCGGVYAQRTFEGAPPLAAAIMASVIGALLAAPLGIVAWIADPPDLGAFGAMVALGVTSSGLAFLIYFELIRRLGATRTLTVTYLQPIVAIALGVVLLGESLRLLNFVGLVLILLGVALVNGQLRLGRRQRRTDAAVATRRISAPP
jgi:drug/metabolite transporter (DMT)-like permease